MQKLRVQLQEKVEFNSSEAQFIKHNNRYYRVKIWSGGDSFVITDMTNAGKRGTVCTELSVNSRPLSKNECPCWDKLLRDHSHKLFDITTSQKLPEEYENHSIFTFYLRESESKRLLALDLSTIKPLKTEPKKWTIPHAIRAIINGQYEGLRCKYRHLDDNCHDYGKGEIKDPVNFAKSIINNPSGWWVLKNGNGTVTICCHSFDSNEFIPKIELGKKIEKAPSPITPKENKKAEKVEVEVITEQNATEFLKKEGIEVTETMTEPKRAGKSPRPVWQVSGVTDGLEEVLFNIDGCSKRRYRGVFSFWEGDPSLEIAKAINEQCRLSFSEQMERKEDRARNRAAKYEQFADNARDRSQGLDKQNITILDAMAGTPILIGHHSEKRHRKELERINNRTRKSINEGEKADYYERRSAHIGFKYDKEKYNLGYLHNRISENEAIQRKLERQKEHYSDYEVRMKQVNEKLKYFRAIRNQVIEEQKENGKIIPSPSTIDKEDQVKYRGTWYPVVRVNKKTVTIGNWLEVKTFTWKTPYDEISDIKKSA